MTTIFCACGTEWTGDDLTQCPWERLEVAGRLRCWNCGRALTAAAQAGAGVVPQVVDLPPKDRGALKKLPERPALREGVGDGGNLEWE